MTKDDRNFNFETVQKRENPRINAISSPRRLSRNDPVEKRCHASVAATRASRTRSATGRRSHRPPRRHRFGLKPIHKTGGDRKRFGAEINHVKERSAERVSRSPGDVYCIIINYYNMSTRKFGFDICRSKHFNPGWTLVDTATKLAPSAKVV
jgi:hypothetical protein